MAIKTHGVAAVDGGGGRAGGGTKRKKQRTKFCSKQSDE
jgi:hypothetical protein